jgi:hypothetical protein
MTNETAATRAWLDARGLADAELLHQLPNQDPDGRELTDAERQLFSALLEARRMVVPGYRPPPADQPTIEGRPGSAEPPGLFDPGPARPPQRAAVERADRRAQRPVRPTARRHGSSPPACRRADRDRKEPER